jgi:hypothetical protein
MANEEGYLALKDAALAVWNSASSWGEPVDLYSASILNVTQVLRTAERRGDGAITTTHANVDALDVEVEFQFTGVEQMSALFNWDIASGSSGSVDTSIAIDKNSLGYFGLAGKVEAAGGGTSWIEVFIPKLQIRENLTLEFGQDNITAQRVRARAMYNDDEYRFGKIIRRASEPTLSFPPADLS